MEKVDADTASARFLELLDRVARGEEIAITRGGVAVAMLMPVPEAERSDVKAAIEEGRRY